MTPTEQLLRDALERIKLNAVSLADAQVIALEALAAASQQAEGTVNDCLTVAASLPSPAPQAAVPSDREECEHCQLWSKWADRIGKLIQEVGLPSTAPSSPVAVSDSEILEAVKAACGTGKVSLTWINNDGIEKPTDVARCFARALSRTAPGVAEDLELSTGLVREMIIAGIAHELAEQDGIEGDDKHELIYEGHPPEPWGEVWQKYEPDATRLLDAGISFAKPFLEQLNAAFPSAAQGEGT